MERIARGVCALVAAIAMVFSNAVAEEDVFMWDGANDGKTVFWNGLAPETSALIWPGVTLKDVKDIFAARGGAYIGHGIFNPVTLSRTDEKWVVQLQCFDLPYLKVLHLELVQKDDGVWAKAYNGWYVNTLETHRIIINTGASNCREFHGSPNSAFRAITPNG